MKKTGTCPKTCFLASALLVFYTAALGNSVSQRMEFVKNEDKIDVIIA
ncbi:MAG: hypothetical protein JW837_08335 [Sedimentisphaerales bacterium]|nr:hypothetical protein [Sedimentisphaerales bacterium]